MPFFVIKPWIASLFALILFGQQSDTAGPPVPFAPNLSSTELDALQALYDSTNGSTWTYNVIQSGVSWDFNESDPNPCKEKWEGVQCSCSSTSCVVSELGLSSHNLKGRLPAEMGNMSSLQALYLGNNHISGSLPEELTLLKSLVLLDIRQNFFFSTVPKWIGNLSSLRQVNISQGFFYGTLPDTLYSMTNLTLFSCRQNFLEGTINLRQLDLSQNKLNGTIPAELGTLFQLEDLRLTKNYLEGSVPLELCQLSNLTGLQLSVNELHGPIPPCLSNLTALQSLYMGENYFYGEIPRSLAALTNLSVMDLSDNLLSGSLPDSIGENKKLVLLYLYQNAFTGRLPLSFSNLSLLQILDLNLNQLHGDIYYVTMAMPELNFIDVASNFFTGPLPPQNWSTLFFIAITTNYFTGQLPVQYGYSIALNFLEMGNNLLSGTLPSSYGASRALTYLAVNDNLIGGSIPKLMGGDFLLAQLFVNNNLFTGSLPTTLGNLSLLAEIDASFNKLTGSIPSSYTQLRNLQIFFVSNNFLTGNLLGVFNSTEQHYLTDVDVSSNQFTGHLPIEPFLIPSLSSFAASSNCLSGTLPPELCNPVNLTALILDGLSTAPSCRIELFPTIPYFDAFVLQYSLTGSIPDCLYSRPNLRSLHLSGNQLTGTLPSNLDLSNSYLLDLALSHNLLDGTLPASLQTKAMRELDLSYNRFRGGLRSDFHTLVSGGALFLQVNRLSGTIPSSLKDAQNISILDGNMFTCDFARTQLPRHDKESSIYVCGSSTVDKSIYVYLIMLALPTVMLFVVLVYYSRISSTYRSPMIRFFREAYAHCLVIDGVLRSATRFINHNKSDTTIISKHSSGNFATKSLPDSTSIPKLVMLFDEIKRLFAYVGMFIILVLLPLYLIISSFAKTYDHEYTWGSSAVLLEGSVASVLLTIAFTSVFAITVYSVLTILRRLDGLSFTSNLATSNELSRPTDHYNAKTFFRLFLLLVVNVSTMIAVDCVYVYIVISYNNTVVVITQILMAVFKIVWNEGALWALIPLTKRDMIKPALILAGLRRRSIIRRMKANNFPSFVNTHVENLDHVIEDYKDKRSPNIGGQVGPHMGVTEVKSPLSGAACEIELTGKIVNKIEPDMKEDPSEGGLGNRKTVSFAVDMADKEDLRSIIRSTTSTLNTFPSASSGDGLTVDSTSFNTTIRPSTNSDEYDLADIQFLVFNTMLNNIIVPAVAIACISSSCFHNALIAQPANGDTYIIEQCAVFLINYYQNIAVCGYNQPVVKTVTYNPPFIYSYQCASTISINYSAVFIFMFTIVGLIMPLVKVSCYSLYHNLTPSNPYKGYLEYLLPRRFLSPSSDTSKLLIFHKGKFTVKVVSYLAIIISFGTIFPPLAVIGCVSSMLFIIVEQFLLGSLVLSADRLVLPNYRSMLSSQCRGTVDLFNGTVWQIMPFACLVLGYIIFDTMGYTKGWRHGLVITFLFIFPPFFSRIMQRFFIRFIYPTMEAYKRSQTRKRGGSQRKMSRGRKSSVVMQRLARAASIVLMMGSASRQEEQGCGGGSAELGDTKETEDVDGDCIEMKGVILEGRSNGHDLNTAVITDTADISKGAEEAREAKEMGCV